jgi:hypothetical protein
MLIVTNVAVQVNKTLIAFSFQMLKISTPVFSFSSVMIGKTAAKHRPQKYSPH